MGFEPNMKRERVQSGMEDAQDGEPSDAFPSEPNPFSVRTGFIYKTYVRRICSQNLYLKNRWLGRYRSQTVIYTEISLFFLNKQ
jgi:hypothetical protein